MRKVVEMSLYDTYVTGEGCVGSKIWMKPKVRTAACYADQAFTEHEPIR